MPPPSVVAARAGSPALDALADAVRAAKGDDLFAPVLVVAPGLVPTLHLRRALARRGGIVGVEVLTMGALAARLAPEAAAKPGLRPEVWTEAVRVSLREAPGVFARVATHPSAVRRIAAALQRLRPGDAEEREAHAQLGARQADLQRLLTDVEARLGDRVDGAALLRAASAALRSGSAPAHAPVVLHGHRAGDAPADGVVRGLVRAERLATAVVPLVGDARADAASLAVHGLVFPPDPDDEQPVVWQASAALVLPTRLAVCPDATTEAAYAARLVVQAIEAGTPLGRIGVVALGDASARARVARSLDLAQVPWSGPPAAPLRSRPPARALLGLLALPTSTWRREEVLAVLSSGPVRLHAGLPTLVPVDRWAGVVARANVVRGRAQWRERTELLSRGRSRDLELATQVAELHAFLDDLDAFDPPDDGAPWVAWSRWALAVHERFVRPPAGAGSAPVDAWDVDAQLRAVLEGLAALDDCAEGPGLADLLAALDDALARPGASRGAVGRDVLLRSLPEVAGAELAVLVIVGAVEGALPRRRGDDPLVPDDERAVPSARTRQQRRDDEKAALLTALAAATTSHLVMHRSSGQAVQRPSRWFLEAAGRRADSPDAATAESLDRPRELDPSGEWLTIVPSALALASMPLPWGSETEHRTASLLRWRAAAGDVLGHPLVLGGPLAAGAELLLGRRYRRLTRHTGLVGPGVVLPTPVSASTLEDWVACPRRYLYRRVLGVGVREGTEEHLAMEARSKGSTAHRAMEQVVASGAGVQQPDVPWGEDAHGIIDDVVLAARADLLARGLRGVGVLGDLTEEEVVTQLHQGLLLDDAARADGRWVPQGAEVPFGGPERPVAVTTPSGRVVALHGRIDRVDVGWPTTEVRVTDLKTGRQTSIRSHSRAGSPRHLQLAIYATAAGALYGVDPSTVSTAWFVLGSDNGPVLWPDGLTQDRLATALDGIAEGVEEGLFPMDPGEPRQRGFASCSYCPYDRICPTDRKVISERTADDPVLVPFRRAREEVLDDEDDDDGEVEA